MEVKSHNSVAALMKAAWEGNTGEAQALIHDGVDVNARDAFGRTALIIAASQGHTYIVQLLLEQGADPDTKDNVGTTALIAAEARGYARIASHLRASSAHKGEAEVRPFNRENNGTPSSTMSLQRAVDQGDIGNVNALISGGADVNSRTEDGWTPLMLATIKGYADVARALLQRGADVNARNKKGWTALMFAVSMGDLDTLRVLLEGKAELDARDNDGKTALMQATSENNIDSLRVLIESGADVNVVDRLGETALTIAARRGYQEIVELLKKAGAMGDTFQPPTSSSVLDIPRDLMKSTDAIFNEGELQRLKEELDDLLPQTWPTEDAFDATTAETPQSLTPAQLSDLGERLLAAIIALRPLQLPAKPAPSIADIAHKLMLTLAEAAALSNLSRNHLRQAIKTGTLKAQKIGRGWRIKRTDLDAYISAL
ncbi:MAG TPA: ankyrin repeat domain-containing protein [Pyrinomonadaceae bacterium]|jgi:excisionase family DNA binding protein